MLHDQAVVEQSISNIKTVAACVLRDAEDVAPVITTHAAKHWQALYLHVTVSAHHGVQCGVQWENKFLKGPLVIAKWENDIFLFKSSLLFPFLYPVRAHMFTCPFFLSIFISPSIFYALRDKLAQHVVGKPLHMACTASGAAGFQQANELV